MIDTSKLIEQIRKSFCNLTKFKDRGDLLEIVTAFSTINERFISVFVAFKGDKFIITDNGWIDQNYYDAPENDTEDLIMKIGNVYKEAYSVKSTTDGEGVEYFYKTCTSIEQLPSLVFDLANFSVGLVNSFCVQYKDETEEKERETFRSDANDFLKQKYSNHVKFRQPLEDFKNIRFSALITKGSDLYLLNYVTGSTPYYFENELRKSIVNFEITERSLYNQHIKEKISLFNDSANGYIPHKSGSLIELLSEKMTQAPILWSNKSKLLDIVNSVN